MLHLRASDKCKLSNSPLKQNIFHNVKIMFFIRLSINSLKKYEFSRQKLKKIHKIIRVYINFSAKTAQELL